MNCHSCWTCKLAEYTVGCVTIPSFVGMEFPMTTEGVTVKESLTFLRSNSLPFANCTLSPPLQRDGTQWSRAAYQSHLHAGNVFPPPFLCCHASYHFPRQGKGSLPSFEMLALLNLLSGQRVLSHVYLALGQQEGNTTT